MPKLSEKRKEEIMKQFGGRMSSKYEFVCRDSWVRTNYSEANYIPFELKFRLPPLRKWRIISKRDEFGKIIASRVPSNL